MRVACVPFGVCVGGLASVQHWAFAAIGAFVTQMTGQLVVVGYSALAAACNCSEWVAA